MSKDEEEAKVIAKKALDEATDFTGKSYTMAAWNNLTVSFGKALRKAREEAWEEGFKWGSGPMPINHNPYLSKEPKI